MIHHREQPLDFEPLVWRRSSARHVLLNKSERFSLVLHYTQASDKMFQ